jgi:hypothetical protein
MPTLFLTKTPKTNNGEKKAFSTNGVEKMANFKKLKLDPCLSPCVRINSK